MLTHQPLYEPLRAAYLHKIKRKRSWRRVIAWAVFIAGIMVYAIALLFVL